MEPKEYRVLRLEGDYAILEDIEAPGETLLIARALLPEETDEGMRLHYELFAYTVVED